MPFAFTLLIFPNRPLKPGHRIFNRVIIHTEGDTEIAGSVETTAGNHQDTFFFQCIYKFDIIRYRRSREEVESSGRFNELIAKAGQTITEHVPFAGIFRDIDTHPLHAGNDALHQCRGVDIAENSIGHGHGRHEIFSVSRGGIYRNESDTLTGDGNIFGIRGPDDAVFIGFKNAWDDHAVIDNFAVRLIRQKINRSIKRFAFLR